MLRHGELREQGVVFDISLVERIMPPNKAVYFIQGGQYKEHKFADITGGPLGTFRTLELSEKFETEIDRYQIMNIANAGADEKKEFLWKFAEVVLAEKRRQMNHNLTGQTDLPWSVTNVFSMPMVIWLRKGQGR